MTFENRFLAHNLSIYGRIFKIQTAKVQVRPGLGHTTFGFGNLLPVWPGKSKMTFGDMFLAHNLRSIGQNFKIQTVFV